MPDYQAFNHLIRFLSETFLELYRLLISGLEPAVGRSPSRLIPCLLSLPTQNGAEKQRSRRDYALKVIALPGIGGITG
ncbi:MAG: hypothetical protein LBC27_02785 [Spirochaetaceae bacterium]|nr:hypothetical protein [Spirochaetaceae bacterium]